MPCGTDPTSPAECGGDLFFYERVADGVLRYEYVDVFCILERSQLQHNIHLPPPPVSVLRNFLSFTSESLIQF
jgi:hypothetical protein